MYSIASLLSKSDVVPADPSQSLTLRSRERIQIICVVAETILAVIGILVAIYLHGIVGAVGGGVAGFCALDLLIAYVIHRVKKCTAAAQAKRQTPLQKPADQSPQKPSVVTPRTRQSLRPKPPVVILSLEKITDQRKTRLEQQKSELTQKLESATGKQEKAELSARLNTVENELVSLSEIVAHKDSIQSFYANLDALDKANAAKFTAQLNAQLTDLKQPETWPPKPPLIVITSPEKTIEEQRSELTQKLQLLQNKINSKTTALANRIKYAKDHVDPFLKASKKELKEFNEDPVKKEQIIQNEIARRQYKNPKNGEFLRQYIPSKLQNEVNVFSGLRAEHDFSISKIEKEIEALKNEYTELSKQLESLV